MTAHALYRGTVTHARTHEGRHAFAYPLYMHLFDLADLDAVNDSFRLLGYNRRRPVAVHDADHFDGRPLAEAVRAEVEKTGAPWPGGRVQMLTNARIFGYVFNPITLYYCLDTHDTLATVVAEVHNTFGERHVYVLRPAHDGPSAAPLAASAKKAFHVSPFFSLDGTYRFELPAPDALLAADIDLEVGGVRRLAARLRLQRQALTESTLAWMLLRYPLMTLQVIGAIHWEALRLWSKGVKYLPKPAYAPETARRTQP